MLQILGMKTSDSAANDFDWKDHTNSPWNIELYSFI